MTPVQEAALLDHARSAEAARARRDSSFVELAAYRRAELRTRGWIVRRMLFVADVVGLVAAFLVAEVVAGVRSGGLDAISVPAETTLFVITLPAWIVVAKIYGLYDRDEERAAHSTVDDLVAVFHLVTVGAWLFLATAWMTRLVEPSFAKLFVFWIVAVATVASGRACARAIARRNVAYVQNAIVVGAGSVGQLVAKTVLQHPEYGINVVGFVDDDPRPLRDEVAHVAVLGSPKRIASYVRLYDVGRVFIAFSRDSHERTLDLLRSLNGLDVQVDIVPRFFDRLGPSIALHDLGGLPMVGLPPLRLRRSSLLLKRTVDVAASFVALVVLAPLLALVAVCIKLDSRGPVFYRHRRVGRDARPFELLKFRTMRLDACRGERYGGAAAEETFRALMSDPAKREEFASSYKLHDDPRVTRLGRLLRRTSLDELPQLWNVLLGDISLVGPRPITTDELERYGRDAQLLLGIKPGVTGYWQINGRSDLHYDERVRLDVAYVGGWSLKLDLEILAKTVRVLLGGSGAC